MSYRGGPFFQQDELTSVRRMRESGLQPPATMTGTKPALALEDEGGPGSGRHKGAQTNREHRKAANYHEDKANKAWDSGNKKSARLHERAAHAHWVAARHQEEGHTIAGRASKHANKLSSAALGESSEGGSGSGRHKMPMSDLPPSGRAALSGKGVAAKFLQGELKKRGQRDVPDVQHTGRAGD